MSDYIKRETLMARIRGTGYDNQVKDIILAMAAIIPADALEELSKPKWIPVTERLPEHTGDTLVIVGVNRNGLGMFNEIRVANYNIVFGGWTVYETNRSVIGDITHWMPLPEQPKPQEINF